MDRSVNNLSIKTICRTFSDNFKHTGFITNESTHAYITDLIHSFFIRNVERIGDIPIKFIGDRDSASHALTFYAALLFNEANNDINSFKMDSSNAKDNYFYTILGDVFKRESILKEGTHEYDIGNILVIILINIIQACYEFIAHYGKTTKIPTGLSLAWIGPVDPITPWFFASKRGYIYRNIFGPSTNTISVIIEILSDNPNIRHVCIYDLSEECVIGILLMLNGDNRFIVKISGIPIDKYLFSDRYNIAAYHRTYPLPDEPHYSVRVWGREEIFSTVEFIRGIIIGAQLRGVNINETVYDLKQYDQNMKQWNPLKLDDYR